MDKNKKAELMQAFKFACFSASAGAIQVVSDILFVEVFHMSPSISYFIALILSVLWNFTLNRKFTFKSASNIPIAMLKVAGYYTYFTPLSLYWTRELVEVMGFNNYIILAITMIINLITEFLFQKYFVFNDKKKEETADNVEEVIEVQEEVIKE